MLHFIRERAQGWVAWFIVGLISIPFALWGVNSYITGPSDVVTASVDGEPIKQAEFQQALQQYRDRMREAMGDRFDPVLLEGTDVKKSVLDGLIEQKLLQIATDTLGQRISDASINNLIKSTPAFQTESGFDPERYRLMLARVGLTPAGYEAQLRIDLLIQELTNNIQQTAFASDFAINNILRLEKQTRDISYGVVSAQSQLEQVVVTDEDVRNFYDINKHKYMAPERTSVNYVELSVDELAKTIAVDEDLLRQFYIDNQDQFVGPEQRRASHILIEGDEEQALPILTTIKERLDSGDDFSLLAVEFSQDTGSAQDGGDLGLFQRGVMDPAFEEAVFSMSVIGDVSEPIMTEYGYHIIKLTDIKKPEGKSFNEAQAEIDVLYRRQKAEELFFEQAEKLADISYENPDNLDVVAEELSLEVKTTDAFTRDGGSGIASDKNVVNIAFSEDVLINDLNSTVIELTKSHLLVLHKNNHILASQLPFDSIAPAITEQLRFERARDVAREQGEAILTKLKAGVSAGTLFSEDDWHDVQAYSRASSDVSQQVLENAFILPKPVADKASFTGFTASNGNYIVVKVTAVTDGNPADASEDERDGLQSYLVRINGSSELEALVESLKTDVDIVIMDKTLN